MILRAGKRALRRRCALSALFARHGDMGGGLLNEGAVRRGRRTPNPWGTGYRTVARNVPLAPPSAASDAAREPSIEGSKDSFPQVLDRWAYNEVLGAHCPRGLWGSGADRDGWCELGGAHRCPSPDLPLRCSRVSY